MIFRGSSIGVGKAASAVIPAITVQCALHKHWGKIS